MYLYGDGVPMDNKKAAGWTAKAAKHCRVGLAQGGTTAQHPLGVMYLHGLGVSKDEMKGVKLLRKAVEQGDVAARNALEEFKKKTMQKKAEEKASAFARELIEEEESKAKDNTGSKAKNKSKNKRTRRNERRG
jgi:TPR repeat protein